MTEKPQNQINIDNMLGRMTKLTKISPTMCSAKWLQSTTYLMNGWTHSCHHPSPHKIPLDEVLDNPKALHNTQHKKEQRQAMLRGDRPSECEYCWNIEDLPGDHISDRVYKSTDEVWSTPYLNRLDAAWHEDVNPTYFEVAFENTCNFKCMYCSPEISSKWMDEIKRHGPYPTSMQHNGLDYLKRSRKMPIPNREYNPYVEAFWKWWPELYETLQVFRITGGEPLMSKHTWRLLEYIDQNPRADLELAINTNLQAPEQFMDRLMVYYNKIAPKIKRFKIFTSVEAKGKPADYIRYGMDYDLFWSNVRRFLSETPSDSALNFMVAFNALSVTTFHEWLNDVVNLRDEFNEHDGYNRLPMMINFIRWPLFQDCRILPVDIKKHYGNLIYETTLEHTKKTRPSYAGRFYLEEVDQVKRLQDYMNDEWDQQYREQQMRDFFLFFQEYDLRRNCEFSETFPELMDFYEQCRALTYRK